MKKPLVVATAIVIAAVRSGATDPRPFRQTDLHGLVSIEVENFHAQVPAGAIGWAADATPGSSGAALIALPNDGVVVDTNLDSTSPRLEYQVLFAKRGRYRVWVRGFGPTPSDDSIWVGVAGESPVSIDIADGAWGWSNVSEGGRRAIVRVPAAGVQTVTIWMREDGTKIDKLVLVDDTFEPCGVGPDESPHDPALDGEYAAYAGTLPRRCDPASNQPPTVNAGANQEISYPTSATLSGALTDDGLPAGSLTVAWTQISGPGIVTFGAPTSPTTSAAFPSAGTYVLRLTATDGALSASDDVSVTVHPQPDLRVDGVTGPSVDPQTLAIVGPGTLAYTNVGGPTLAPYTIVFWEDRDGTGVLDPGTDNVLGSATESARLGSGESRTIQVALSSDLLFAGNVVHAFVDSSNALGESDETNNIGNSAPACQARGPERPFAPAVKWAWTTSGTAPESRNVIMTPAVADLTGDGVPDVVFTTFATSDVTGNLRAVDGRTGTELWTVTNTGHTVYARSQVAVANIDADPQPEVIAYGNAGPTLAPGDSVIAFEHDGTFKWQTGLNQAQLWGGPAVGDIDGDGTPEIAAGRIVLNADGSTRWTGALGSGAFTNGPLAVIADLDMDGQQEVVTGRQAYNADGTTMWVANSVTDGLDAIGNFDADADPEVVVAGLGMFWVLEHTGAIKYSVSTSGLGGSGGGVTIADFDGDGHSDIGRAGSTAFGVYRGSDGMQVWTAPIAAAQTGRVLAAAFDLDGDGTREAVVSDEWGVRVFRGSDGAELAAIRLGMCTGYTMPVIADVDQDGRADILTGANTACSLGNTQFGLYVFSDDAWRGAGKIWNQHTYHITNINDVAAVPSPEPPSWLLDNSYRAAATAACPFPAADLTASYLRVTANGDATRLTVRVGNAGTRTVPASVPVAYYDGDPRAGGILLGIVHTSVYLEGGSFEDVNLDLLTPATTGTIWVAVDDDGAGGSRIYELNESNNLLDSGVQLGPL